MRRFLAFLVAAAMVTALAVPAAATDATTVVFAPVSPCMVTENTNVSLPDVSYTSGITTLLGYTVNNSGKGTTSLPYVQVQYCMSNGGAPLFREGSDLTINIPANSVGFVYTKIGFGTTSYSGDYRIDVQFAKNTDNGIVWYTVVPSVTVSGSSVYSVTIDADDISGDVYGVAIRLGRGFNYGESNGTFTNGTCRVGFKPGSITIVGNPVKLLGLLGSILQFIQSIFDTLGNVLTAIIELPGKIANLIIEGLKTLFIPTQDDLNGLFDEFGDSFKEKLGFLWQAGEIVTGFWDGLTNQTEAGTIQFPGLSLSFGGATFSLPAQAVSLWPGGFEALKEPVRLGSTAVLVFMWIRGLLRRLDAILNPGGD